MSSQDYNQSHYLRTASRDKDEAKNMTEFYRVCRECKRTTRVSAQFCSHCGQALPKEVEIFLSYAHEDKKLLNELIKQLTIFKRMGMTMLWTDLDISSGSEWKKSISTHLDTADIILLLISPDFIASDFCYSKEMTRAMERYRLNEACVIPVILRPTPWQKAPFGILQALPSPAKAVVEWENKDQALCNVAEGIKNVLNKRFGVEPPEY
jgi:hypothetical protein